MIYFIYLFIWFITHVFVDLTDFDSELTEKMIEQTEKEDGKLSEDKKILFRKYMFWVKVVMYGANLIMIWEVIRTILRFFGIDDGLGD